MGEGGRYPSPPAPRGRGIPGGRPQPEVPDDRPRGEPPHRRRGAHHPRREEREKIKKVRKCESFFFEPAYIFVLALKVKLPRIYVWATISSTSEGSGFKFLKDYLIGGGLKNWRKDAEGRGLGRLVDWQVLTLILRGSGSSWAQL